MRPKNRRPSHPGEILKRIFLIDMNISQSELARHIGCKPGKINEIVRMKRGVTAEMALTLADAFQTSPEFWLNLQSGYELWEAAQSHKKIKSLSA